MIVLLWVLWIFLAITGVILGLALLVVLLSAVPVRYTLCAKKGTSGDFFHLRVTWLFRAIVYENRDGKSKLRVFFFRIGKKRKRKAVKKAPEKKKPPREKETSRMMTDLKTLTWGQVKPIIKPMGELLRKIIRRVKPAYMEISGRIGFPCPYETGLFFAGYETITRIFGVRGNIRLEGDFNTDELVADITALVRGKVTVLRLVLPVVSFLMKKPVRTFMRRSRGVQNE